MKKLNLIAIISGVLLSASAMASTHQGRIIEAQSCSQNKDAGYFTSNEQRDLKCKRIKLPANDVCDATLTNDERPSKIKLVVPGLDEHRGTSGGSITFSKGGVVVYESSKRTGVFSNKKKLFSNQAAGDQLEFLLKRNSRGYELNKVAIYLDHTAKGNRLYWTEYTCRY